MRAAALVVLLVATVALSSCASAPASTSTSTTGSIAVSTTASPVVSTPPVVGNVASDCAGAGTVEQAEAPFGAPGARLASVYLPACYARDAERRFPVVFLLHGAGADATQWPAIGLATTADDLITSGAIPPMIVVMPDGGVTMADGLAAELVDRLVPWVDQTYRTVPDAADRAVGGISRGGRVALLAAAMHPGVFSGVGGHSPAVGAGDDAIAARLSGIAGPIRLDVGAKDALRPGVEHFATRVVAAGGSADLVEAPGGHNRAYWRSHTSDYLRFYASLVT
jgi:enterochelin esterase-like enzyme